VLHTAISMFLDFEIFVFPNHFHGFSRISAAGGPPWVFHAVGNGHLHGRRLRSPVPGVARGSPGRAEVAGVPRCTPGYPGVARGSPGYPRGCPGVNSGFPRGTTVPRCTAWGERAPSHCPSCMDLQEAALTGAVATLEVPEPRAP
jgi:hypothetical protein